MASSQLVLLEGEQVLAIVKGEFFAVYSNFLLNVIAKIIQFIMFLLGKRSTGQLVVTNKRIVVEKKDFSCWCFPSAATFECVPFSGIASVQYGFLATCLCCLCRKYVLTVSSKAGNQFGLIIKGGEAEASGITNLIFWYL